MTNPATGLVHQVMGGGGAAADPLTPQIYDLVNGVLTLQETGGVATLVAPGLVTIYQEDNPLGCRDLRTLFIDGTLVGAPTVLCTIFYRIVRGGGLVWASATDLSLVEGLTIIDLKPNRYGVKITLHISVGDPPTGEIPWEIFIEA